MNFMNLKILAALTMLLSAHSVRAEELKVNPEAANLLPQGSLETNVKDPPATEIKNFGFSSSPRLFLSAPNITFHDDLQNLITKKSMEAVGAGEWKKIWENDLFNAGSADATLYVDPFCKEEVSEASLTKLAEDTNWSKCFESRNSGSSEKERLQKDMDACSCLRNWPTLPAVREAMSANVVKARPQAVAQKELNEVLNGILFDAYTITNRPDTTSLYSANFYTKNADKKERELKFQADLSLVIDKVPYPEGQCISPRDVILDSQLPNPLIIENLTGDYDDKKWNYKKLYARYDEIMKLPLAKREEFEEEVIAIKATLRYLNKNPLIKYAFSVDTGELPEAQKLKDAVYSTLGLHKSKECEDLTSQCYKDYQAKLSKIYTHEKVVPLIRKEAKLDHEARVKRKLSKALNENRPIKREDITQRSIVNEFMEKFQLGSPDTCQSGTSQGLECIEIFNGYCKTLDKYNSDIAGLSPEVTSIPLVLDDLDDDLRDHFNTDINTNKLFKKKNDDACNTPRMKGNGVFKTASSSATFNQFLKRYCSDSARPGCARSSAGDYATLRGQWEKDYPIQSLEGVHILGDKKDIYISKSGLVVRATSKNNIVQGVAKEMSKGDISKVLTEVNKPKDERQIAFEMSKIPSNESVAVGSKVLADMKEAEKAKTEAAKTPFMAGVGQAIANNMGSSLGDPTAPPVFDEIPQNFGRAGAFSSNFSQAASTTEEVSKVEDMSEDKRRELLGDWQKDYDQWKKEKGSDLSPADKAQDSALRQEIATLRALLDQQKEMSKEQFRLLNDALASKKGEQQALAKQEIPDAVKKTSSQFSAASRSEAEMDNLRAPASVKEAKMNTSGAMSGGVSAAISSRRSTKASEGSNESLAREQAKLVNMRRYADGTITIESAGAGASTQVNAITVPVSDEQYKMLQVNPTGLSLTQIERNIPKDQIAKLEKSGEIIILLRNGSNPPFEVKVAKKDNRLVYSLKDKDGKDQTPIRRVYTRQALELELKAQK